MALTIIRRKKTEPLPPADPLVPEPKREIIRPEPDKILDGQCQAVIKVAPNAIVSWYLIASFLYYHHDISILSDGYYDALAKQFIANYDTLTHPHKSLVSKDDLDAGTLYHLPLAGYPSSTQGAAARLALTATGIRLPY